MVKKASVVLDESPLDDFDPADPYKDLVAMLEIREHIVREKWIDIETAKIIEKNSNGVMGLKELTTFRNASMHLVEQYLESTRGIGWGEDARPPCFYAPKVDSRD